MKEENIDRAQIAVKELRTAKARLGTLSIEKSDIRIEIHGGAYSSYFSNGYMDEKSYEVIKLLLIQETKKKIELLEAEVESL